MQLRLTGIDGTALTRFSNDGRFRHEARRGGANTASGDPISGTTALLDTMFRPNRIGYMNGALMQEAIWFLKEERTTRSRAAATLIARAQADWSWPAGN